MNFLKIRFVAFFLIAFSAFALSAAFSSEKWLAERGDDTDMMRLRAAYRECVKKLESPAENVMFPLENYPDGTIKTRLRAKRAHLFVDSGFIWGEGIRIEQYEEDGTVSASLDADNCIVDKKSKTGWIEGSAKMTYRESSVKGRGIYFSFAREFIKILSQSEVRTKPLKMDSRSLVK